MTYSSTLDGAITADTTDVFVDDAPTVPYPPFVQVGSELMAVVSGDVGTDFTQTLTEATYDVEPFTETEAAPGRVSRVGVATATGAVLVVVSDLGTATSGALDCYALIATPA